MNWFAPELRVGIIVMCVLDKSKSQISKKLLLIDEDECFRNSLQKYLYDYGFHVDAYAQGEVLPAVLRKKQDRVDLIVLEVELLGKNGIYWLKWLRQYHAYIPVLVMSKRAGKDDRVLGLEHGASDYMIKPFSTKELLIRVKNILSDLYSDSGHADYLCFGDVRIDTMQAAVIRNGQAIALTQLELNIIKLLYKNIGLPVSRDDFMFQLRGNEFNPLGRSIDVHIHRLRNKLENRPSKPAYIRTVRGKGYVLHLP